MNIRKQPILLVEDNDDDAFFVQRAFDEAGVQNSVSRVANGQEAIDYLGGHGSYSDRSVHPLPCLVLLDLQLPSKSGAEVLEWVHSRPELYGLIVVVLTSSDHPEDVSLAYKLGARSYLIKPPTAQQLKELIASLKTCWVGYGPIPPIALLERDNE